jgi:hypothetical protein
MNFKNSVIFSCLIIISSGINSAQGEGGYDPLSFLNQTQQQQCGIHKLSVSERRTLGRWFSVLFNSNKVADSALEYLKNEGWVEVNVLGVKTLKVDEWSVAEDFLIVQSGLWTYVLEPRSYNMLRRGKYLGKMGMTSCEIIDSSGAIVNFWTEKQE